MICSDKNSRYKVSDTTNGNWLLSNPVGLITADEVIMAGVEYKTKGYLGNSGATFYWTLMPYIQPGSSVYINFFCRFIRPKF